MPHDRTVLSEPGSKRAVESSVPENDELSTSNAIAWTHLDVYHTVMDTENLSTSSCKSSIHAHASSWITG